MLRASTKNTKTVIFASGRGSNFRALCEAVRDHKLSTEIAAVVVNVEGAGVIEVAREFGINTIVIPHAGLSRVDFEKRILENLERLKPDWIVLAGFMRLLTAPFIRKFEGKIINIHPSLLPAFPGTGGYAQALKYGVKLTGATVHLVSEGLDDGPIIAQNSLEVRDDDTEESLSARGLKLEHELYVQALENLFTKSWHVSRGPFSDGRARVVFRKEAI